MSPEALVGLPEAMLERAATAHVELYVVLLLRNNLMLTNNRPAEFAKASTIQWLAPLLWCIMVSPVCLLSEHLLHKVSRGMKLEHFFGVSDIVKFSVKTEYR